MYVLCVVCVCVCVCVLQGKKIRAELVRDYEQYMWCLERDHPTHTSHTATSALTHPSHTDSHRDTTGLLSGPASLPAVRTSNASKPLAGHSAAATAGAGGDAALRDYRAAIVSAAAGAAAVTPPRRATDGAFGSPGESGQVRVPLVQRKHPTAHTHSVALVKLRDLGKGFESPASFALPEPMVVVLRMSSMLALCPGFVRRRMTVTSAWQPLPTQRLRSHPCLNSTCRSVCHSYKQFDKCQRSISSSSDGNLTLVCVCVFTESK